MLGWEFPPYLNGGLGVATAGLASALSALTDLTLILPKSDPAFAPPDMQVVSLQGRTLPEVRRQSTRLEIERLQGIRVRYLDVSLAAYEHPYTVRVAETEEYQLLIERAVTEDQVVRPAQVFEMPQLYGQDLGQRIVMYSDFVLDAARTYTFDVIHAHDWMTFLAGLTLKAHTRKPLVLHVHSLEYDRSGPGHQGWVYELERHALHQADHVVAVSRYTAAILRDVYQVPAERITAVPNGVTPVARFRTAAPFPQRLVSYIGRLTYQKGPDVFFEAAMRVLAVHPGVRFVIGGRGELIELLAARAAKERVGNRIFFTGYMEPDRVTDLLSMTDVYVMPSVSEPFGLSALEAAQMGVPCILSRQSGVAEVLPGALYADGNDPAAFAEMILRLLQDDALRAEVVAAQDQDLKAVGWDASARQVLDVYYGLLD
jgi:hypothetical protein